MQYIYTLYDPETNTTVNYKDDYDWESETSMLFQWLENNYSCDCNRAIFMYGENTERDCGESIQLLKITDCNDKIIYENPIS